MDCQTGRMLEDPQTKIGRPRQIYTGPQYRTTSPSSNGVREPPTSWQLDGPFADLHGNKPSRILRYGLPSTDIVAR